METRLAILAEAGVIDADVHQAMHLVIKRLEQHWQLAIRTEQGTLMLTHMVNAVMRARRGDIIQGIDSELWSELETLDNFTNINAINQDIMRFFPQEIPTCEVGYLLVNLAGLLRNQSASY